MRSRCNSVVVLVDLMEEFYMSSVVARGCCWVPLVSFAGTVTLPPPSSLTDVQPASTI
jgi:hypothetical protein